MAVAPGDADYKGDAVKSPTTLVMEYLAKNKMSPNMPGYSAAVRDALAANAKDPTLIPGLRSDTAATEADDQAAMKAAGKGGSRNSGGGGGRSTLPVDLGHGPTNEADWQPTTTSAPPAAQDVLAMQNATNPAMRAAVPDIPVPPSPSGPATSTTPLPQIPKSPMQLALDDAVATRPQIAAPPDVPALPAPPPQITGPTDLPEAPVAAPNTPIPMPGPQAAEVPPTPNAPRSPGLQVDNVPPPPPDFSIQAPSASSIPPSGGLNVEDKMMPGRGNLTIQAPSAGSMPPTQAPVIQETAPSFKRMLGGAATGAGVGRIMGPGGMALGAVLGAAPEAWNLGKQIIGR